MRQFLLLTAMSILTVSCGKDASLGEESFISYSLDGASCSGAFRIESDGNVETLEVTATIFPASEDNPEVIFISFSDQFTQQQVFFQLPAEETGNNPVLITRDNEYYGMGISHAASECVLVHGVENTIDGVSVDIKKFKRNNGALGFALINELEVHFEGIMSFRNEMGEEERHTVNGDFFYGGIF